MIERARGLSVYRDLERTRAGAAYSKAESRRPVGGFGEIEMNRVWRGAATAAGAAKRRYRGIGVFVMRHLLKIPILRRIALADEEIDVVGKQLGILKLRIHLKIFST